MKHYGESIYGHCGVYTLKQYSDSAGPGPELSYIRRGTNDSCNQVLSFGDGSSSNYVWTCYCGEQRETEVSEGYQHTVYTPYTYEALADIDWLLFFPFVDERECTAYLSGAKQFNASSRSGLADLHRDEIQRPSVDIPRELLTKLACFYVAQKKIREKAFLYFLVPREVTDYQSYCRDVIKQLLDAIPVGFRKGLKIATNVLKEEEKSYHILFKRDDERFVKNSVKIEGGFDPSFLESILLADDIKALITNCVQDTAYLEQCNKLAEKCVENENILTEELYGRCFKLLNPRAECSNPKFLKSRFSGAGTIIRKEPEVGKTENLKEFPWSFEIENLLKQYCVSPDGEIIDRIFNFMGEASRCERQEILARICEKVKNSFEERDDWPSYETITAIYITFSDHLSDGEKGAYLEEKGLTAIFYKCLEEELNKYIKRNKDFKSICNALDTAYYWKDYFSSCNTFLNHIYLNIKNILDSEHLSDNKCVTINSKLLKLYSGNGQFIKELSNGFDEKVSGEEITEKITSFELYFFYFRKRYPLCNSITQYKDNIVREILTSWPLNKRSFRAYLSAIMMVEGRTLEEIANEDDGAIDFYRNECTLFFKDDVGIVMDKYSDLSQIYGELLYYSKLLEQQYVTICFLPSVTNGDYRRKCGIFGKEERFRVSSVLNYLSTAVLGDKIADFQSNEDEDYKKCIEFFAGGSRKRPRIAVKMASDFAMLSLVVVMAYSGIWKWGKLEPESQPESSPAEETLESLLSEEALEDRNFIEEKLMKHTKECGDSLKPKLDPLNIVCDTDNTARKGIRWWKNEEYRSAYGELSTYPISELIFGEEIFGEQGQAIREYLALKIFIELVENDGGNTYSLKNVDFYDIRNSSSISQGIYSESPCIVLSYSQSESENVINIAYFYDKERGIFLTYTDLYAADMDAEAAARQMSDLVGELQGHMELRIKETRTANVNAAMEKIR